METRWYGRPGWLLLLLPLSWLFGLVSRSRRASQCRKASAYKVPVIVVGNISVGGTGKTPTIIALVEFLQNKGVSVGVISRGYGRDSESLVVASDTSLPCELGDEPYLIFQQTKCALAVCSNRSLAIEALIDQAACEVILADDGLQHYSMFRDKEIIVVDAERGFGNRHLLPVGPLREAPGRVDEADWVLVTNSAKTSENFAGQNLHSRIAHSHAAYIEPVELIQLSSGEKYPLAHLQELENIAAVAGLGNPNKFFSTLRQLGLSFREMPFKDHHRYSLDDFSACADNAVVMTEKDAVKCQGFLGDSAYFLRVRLALPEAFLDDFFQSVQQLILSKKI